MWRPVNVDGTNMASFAASVGVAVADLHSWSVESPDLFWRAVWDFCDVQGAPGERVLVSQGDGSPAQALRSTRFFPDATLNVAETLLRPDGAEPALIVRTERALDAREWSRTELRAVVARCAAALTNAGVSTGDRVATWLPNGAENVIVMLAAASIGATFTSTSPDFGVAGVLDRFRQVEPTVLVGTDGYQYGGRVFDRRAQLAEVAASLPSLRATWMVESLGLGAAPPGIEEWSDTVLARAETEPTFVQLPFDHPWYVLYSSGTTGTPKCIVHRAGGVLLKHLTEHVLHGDVRPGDRTFYFTTAGWMMWNWLVSGLGSGATVVLYDGSPFHPDGNAMFDLVDDVGVTLFGTSAKFIDSVAKAGLRPAETHSLQTVRTICSTGSPLVEEGFRFVNEAVSSTAHLASISGGTDLCGCLVAGNPTSPLHVGDIQMPALGLDTVVVDDDGAEVAAGVRGELVCRTPFPSMPLGFWGDTTGERYQAAYFDRFPGLWHQGDFAERTRTGGFVIHGRSDATLNPGGVRIGTAEIYRVVDRFDQVLESLVIGQDWDGDTRVVLFVVLRDGVVLTDDLVAEMKAAVRVEASPRHTPAVIAQVPDIPRTRSNKSTELAVRAIVHGRPVTNREALANPEALDHFIDHPALTE